MGLGARGMHELGESGVLMPFASVMPCAGNGVYYNVADIFNVTAGTWSTAVLSQARARLAATSLPNAGVAIFAGGDSDGRSYSNVVDIFNVTAGTWSTAVLSQARALLAATSLPNAGVAIFAGGGGTCCCVCLSCCRMGLDARGMHEWGSVVC
jgi:hypothetical protein